MNNTTTKNFYFPENLLNQRTQIETQISVAVVMMATLLKSAKTFWRFVEPARMFWNIWARYVPVSSDYSRMTYYPLVKISALDITLRKRAKVVAQKNTQICQLDR